jgi:apolipoprotein N-acyltransferase
MSSADNKTVRRALCMSLIASALYTVALPPWDLGLSALFVGFPLTLAFLDPARPLRRGQAAALGFLFGELTTAAVGGYWLYHAVNGFFGRSVAFSAAFTLATTITHAGAFIGAGVFVAGRLAGLPAAWRILGFASSWVTFEFLRSNLLYGCPWDLLGHALSQSPLLMQAASLGGVYLLGWIAIASSSSAAIGWLERRRPATATACLLFAVLLPAAAVAFGYYTIEIAGRQPAQIAASSPKAQRSLAVGLVQTDIGKHDLWKAGGGPRHLQTFLELSRSSALSGVDLLVWSENAVPFLLDADRDAQQRIQDLADQTGAAVLLGAPRSESSGDGTAQLRNSVYLFSPGESGFRTYDKVRLLPYIEEIPSFAAPFVQRSTGLEYRAGNRAAMFEIAGWRIAPLVCFESTYPQFARDYARAGADLLVNVSNDSWFDRGAAPEQHFAMTVFRAPENRVPLVRVANGGVSAVIDRFGRPAGRVTPRTRAVARVEIRPFDRNPTFYTANGDVFAWTCCGFLALCLVRSGRTGRRVK